MKLRFFSLSLSKNSNLYNSYVVEQEVILKLRSSGSVRQQHVFNFLTKTQ